MDVKAHQQSRSLLDRHRAIAPGTFELLGRQWDILPNVYAPHLTRCAALYAEWIAFPRAGSFCEIGSGSGYISVLAALRGCARVVATDINPAAVANTAMNAKRYGVDSILHSACGDMFEPLGPELFDTIFWNSSYVHIPGVSLDGLNMLERAFHDPGYEAHRAFLRGAAGHLQPNGNLLMGFSSLGDVDRLSRIAVDEGWDIRLERAAVMETLGVEETQQLLRFELS